MAKMKKQVLGKVSGAIGDILFRTMNGKNYVGTRPDSFMPGNDPESIARRQRFALVTRFVRPLNYIYQLKSIWKKVTPAGISTYNYMVRLNYRSVLPDTITDTVKLVPDIGFEVDIDEIILTETLLQVKLNSIQQNAGINPETEKFIKLAGVLYLSNPVNPHSPVNSFIRLISNDQDLDLENPVDFEINFINQTSQVIAEYQDRKAFITLLTLDTSKHPVNYSNTFVSS